MNWKKMNSWIIVEARVRWRRDGWLASWDRPGELYDGFTSTRSGCSTTPIGSALRMLSCSSVVRSTGRALKR